jgi:hypothetical protein
VVNISFLSNVGRKEPLTSHRYRRFVTLCMSSLCLAVALGSAIPTGNLLVQAEELGVSNEAIFLSIALFVVVFSVDLWYSHLVSCGSWLELTTVC